MYISSFHIDDFGIFGNVDVRDLPAGLVIFHGRNEAGKSTCLEFLRLMLTGVYDSWQCTRFLPAAGGNSAGSIVLCCQGANGADDEIHLSRKTGFSGLVLETPDGRSLPPDMLASLFSGVNAEVYRNVFGFGLSELERFENLSASAVQDVLFGASFGPGLASPTEVLKFLDDKKAKIFRPGANNSMLTAGLSELEALRGKIEELACAAEAFDMISLELDNKKAQREEMRAEKNSLEDERRLLERRLASWRQWQQWRGLKERLGEMEPESDVLPSNAEARLARMQEARDACERQLAKIKARVQCLLEQRDALAVDDALLEILPELRLLSERKSGYRHALGAISGQLENCAHARKDLEDGLGKLGAGWDCARIKSTDRSLSANDGLERKAREMDEAITAHKGALIYLDNSNREVELCEAEVAKTCNLLENLPEPAAILNDEERDALKRKMARLEEGRRLVAGHERSLETARHAFTRALESMSLGVMADAGAYDSTDGARKILDGLLARQDDALRLAEKMSASLAESAEAARALAQAESGEEAIRRRIDEHVAAQRENESPQREILEARTVALRSLRSMAASIATKRDRLEELENRINSENPPARIKSWTLMAFGLLFLALAAAIFVAHRFFNLSGISLARQIVVPVNLWGVYGAMSCGVALLAGALSGNGPELKRRRQEMVQLRSSRDGIIKNIAELEARAELLCADAGVDSMDDITLEATEVRLEREKAQCFHDERSLEALNAEAGQARVEVERARQLLRQKENAVRQCRGLWHGLMQGLKVDEVPCPEDAATFFARAEAARLAWDNVSSARNELEALNGDIGELEGAIAAIPAIAQRLESSSDNLSLENAVQLTLESCREADLIQEKRARLQNTLTNLQNELDRARARQQDAAKRLDLASKNEDEARQRWSKILVSFGLGEDLNPATAREAFKCMESALASEDRLLRAQRDVEHSRGELDALEKPLAAMLELRGMQPVCNSDKSPDWLMTLDGLLKNAEDNALKRQERERIIGELAAAQVEKGAEEAALASERAKIQALLRTSGVESEEDFLRLARRQNEVHELEIRIRELELDLASAAGETPLPEFLSSFNDRDEGLEEARLGDISARLYAISDGENELLASIGALSAKLEILSRSDDLALLRQDEAMLRESVRRGIMEWCECALAKAILERARSAFEEKRQPELVRAASEIFARITDDRWKGLSVSLDDRRLLAQPRSGDPVEPAQLSRGAQEQAYLALRLAYIRSHAARSNPLPVLMDEILVNFDPERAKRCCLAIADLAKGVEGRAQQVFYFTCQPHMTEMLREAAPDARIFTVEAGSITALCRQ